MQNFCENNTNLVLIFKNKTIVFMQTFNRPLNKNYKIILLSMRRLLLCYFKGYCNRETLWLFSICVTFLNIYELQLLISETHQCLISQSLLLFNLSIYERGLYYRYVLKGIENFKKCSLTSNCNEKELSYVKYIYESPTRKQLKTNSRIFKLPNLYNSLQFLMLICF